MIVGVIGYGTVGKALAFRLLSYSEVTHIAILDPDENVSGAVLDLSHACQAYENKSLSWNNIEILECARALFHCAGGNVPENGDRRAVVEESRAITENVFKSLELTSEALIIVIANPVDLISYYTQFYSGLPHNQVIGTGTLLDTFRLKYILKNRQIDADGLIVLGEHGRTMFISEEHSTPESYKEYMALPLSKREEIVNELKNSASEIKRTQGATLYGVTEAALVIFGALMNEQERIFPFSALYKDHGVYLSQLGKISKNLIDTIPSTFRRDVERLNNSAINLLTGINFK